MTKKQESILSKSLSNIDDSTRARDQRQQSILAMSSIGSSTLQPTQKSVKDKKYKDDDIENGEFVFHHSISGQTDKSIASVVLYNNSGEGSDIKTNIIVANDNNDYTSSINKQLGSTSRSLQVLEQEEEQFQNHKCKNKSDNLSQMRIKIEGDKDENISTDVIEVPTTDFDLLCRPLSPLFVQHHPQSSYPITATVTQMHDLQDNYHQQQRQDRLNQALDHKNQQHESKKSETAHNTVYGRTMDPAVTNIKDNNNLDFWMDIDDNVPTCSICIEEYTATDHCYLNKTICNHQFHIDCLLNWFEQSFSQLGSNSFHCPCCRREVTVLSKDKIEGMARLMKTEHLSNRALLDEKNVEDTSIEDGNNEESSLLPGRSTTGN
eukprot:CAMPEP_0171321122 /NCGR_PEP_ID=MMETSP0816-20121228/109576_1 /TAXON_ID=420281 /ORGANISM="Proboscia inermis, Strain CCAP1064/1" /LENGTH=377 /DNA_ID=CAMNT_0011818737 /DNA_START=643 /DNA_END=1776 /DNA_ORIENTATION=-